MGPIIALLGAESTGKTTLALTLARQLRTLGREATVVDEYLREFCDAAGRTPHRGEQASIAAEQARRIEAAAQSGSIVLADTTPLMTAVYSDFVFGDPSLYASALAWQRRCDCTLLMGIDLAWQADGLQRDGPQVRAPIDAMVRGALDSAGLPYAVVYGSGEARTAAALAALRPLLGLPVAAGATAGTPGDAAPAADETMPRWLSRCRECLVPGCEHLQRLLPSPPRHHDRS